MSKVFEKWKFLSLFLVLFMILGLGVTYAAGPSTSTVGLKVITDVNEITATNRTLNLSIMGLDSYGNVDTLGESGGADIIAAVQSVLGNVAAPVGPGVPPPSGLNPGAAGIGTFATTTRYILLQNGNGLCNINYPADASGTDTITVILMKRWTEVGQTYTEEITRQTLNIEVAPAAPAAGVLHIRSFTPAATDPNGVGAFAANLEDGILGDNEAEDDGIAAGAAIMTANVAGGVFEVRAYEINPDRSYTLDTNANGTVTITLTGDPTGTEAGGNNKASASDTYSFTGTMVNGVAQVAVPAGITKAGRYKVVATMGDLDSIPDKISDNVATQDYIDVWPLDTVASVGLKCDMSVVSNTATADWPSGAGVDGVIFDPTFTVTLLEQYGNKVRAGAVTSAVTVKVTDANLKISPFSVTVGPLANSATSQQDASGFTAGLASLTASVPANLLIEASPAISLKIVAAKNQIVTAANGANTVLPFVPTTVGAVITNFFTGGIGVDNGAGGGTAGNGIGDGTELSTFTATNKIKLTSLTPLPDGTTESLTVAVKDTNPDNIDVLFTKPLTNVGVLANGFLIQDPDKSYADYIIIPDTTSAFAVNPASAVKAYVKNAAGEVIKSVTATVLPDNSFQVIINGARIEMEDAYENTNNQGTVSITTTKGVVTGTITPGNPATSVIINYPAGTTGEDTLTFSFTHPGVTSVNDGAGLKVVFPTVATLDHFDTYVEDTTLPINGLAPLTIIPKDADGNAITLADGYFIDYDAEGLNLQTAGGGVFSSGSNVGANTGRCVMRVYARTTPGTYTVTIRNASGTITQEVEFTVVEYTAPLQVSSTTVSIPVGGSEAITVSGGVAPYTVTSTDTSIATVSPETLSEPGDFTITGVGVGSTTVTVTDSAHSLPVDISVTVTPAVVEYPSLDVRIDPLMGTPGAAFHFTDNITDPNGAAHITVDTIQTGTEAVDIYVKCTYPDGRSAWLYYDPDKLVRFHDEPAPEWSNMVFDEPTDYALIHGAWWFDKSKEAEWNLPKGEYTWEITVVKAGGSIDVPEDIVQTDSATLTLE